MSGAGAGTSCAADGEATTSNAMHNSGMRRMGPSYGELPASTRVNPSPIFKP
jgi:hypothetical protein